MNLQGELRLRTAYLSLKQLALMIGYSERQAVKIGNRIQMVVTSETLGLDSGNYDFKYSDVEFVLKLCEVLGMDTDECACQVEKLNTLLFEYRVAYRPWLFMDTGFKRKSEPIFALAFMEGHRRLPVSKEIASLPMEQQIPHIQSTIRSHFEETGGRLDLWGEIKCYKYFYAERKSISFDTTGSVIDHGSSPFQPSAKVTHKGHDITKIIMG